jgi:hypothetical protein
MSVGKNLQKELSTKEVPLWQPICQILRRTHTHDAGDRISLSRLFTSNRVCVIMLLYWMTASKTVIIRYFSILADYQTIILLQANMYIH